MPKKYKKKKEWQKKKRGPRPNPKLGYKTEELNRKRKYLNKISNSMFTATRRCYECYKTVRNIVRNDKTAIDLYIDGELRPDEIIKYGGREHLDDLTNGPQKFHT